MSYSLCKGTKNIGHKQMYKGIKVQNRIVAYLIVS